MLKKIITEAIRGRILVEFMKNTGAFCMLSLKLTTADPISSKFDRYTWDTRVIRGIEWNKLHRITLQ